MQTAETTSNKLPQRKIGNDDVPALGVGFMSMNAFYTFEHTDQEAEEERKNLEVLTHAADAGETFWDTSDMYGPYTNEELLGRWFKATGRRKEIFLATKFGIVFDPKTYTMDARGDKEYIRKSLDGSLKRLQTDYVDLYYQHRIDQKTSIEDTITALAELVKEGKVKHLGLSECSTKTLCRAHKVHPIAAIQVEYSLFSLDIEREDIGLKKACDELGVAIVAYSPLGRGILTGRYKSRKDFKEDDWRLTQPRFSEENFSKNLDLVDKISEIAKRKSCTVGQLALAWLLHQGDNIIPIPGTRQIKYLDENLGAVKVTLNEEELKEIREAVEIAGVKGERYDPSITGLYADTI